MSLRLIKSTDARASGSPSGLEKLGNAPSHALLCVLARGEMTFNEHLHRPDVEQGDIEEAVKTRCARCNVEYDSESVRKAVDAVLVADRKSTRLNSSHVEISYAVFCLKKK